MILRTDDLGARDGLRNGGYLAFFVSLFFCCNAESWFLFHCITLLALPENSDVSNCFGVLDVVFCFRCNRLFSSQEVFWIISYSLRSPMGASN